MSEASQPQRLEVVRRGGLAGVTTRASVDLGTVSPEVAASLEAVLSGRIRATPLGGRADTFTYEFTSGEGDRRRTARVAEHDLPRDLRSFLDGLAGHWRIGR